MTAPSPSPPARRSQLAPGRTIAKPKGRTVAVTHVDRFNPEQPTTLPPPGTLTHPSLLYFPAATTASQFQDMKLTAHLPPALAGDKATPSSSASAAAASSTQKRHRYHPLLPDDCPLPDLVARSQTHPSQSWHAAPAFHDMNSDYFILVRNKRTNATRLVQTSAIYRMRRRTGGDADAAMDDRSSSEEEYDEQGDSVPKGDDLTYAQRRKMLLDGFGGRKAKLRMRRYTRDRITEEKVGESTAENVSKAARDMVKRDTEAGIDRAVATTTEASAPPHDSDATAVHEAYPLLGLMTPTEFAALEAEANALLDSAKDGSFEFDNPGWNTLVWRILKVIVAEPQLGVGMRAQRIQAAMYLHYLLVLASADRTFRVKGANRRAMMEEMAVTEDVFDELLKRFSSPSRFSEESRADGTPSKSSLYLREKSKSDSVKIANHALIAWVTAKGFVGCAGLDDLSREVGVSAKLLASYAMSMACKVQKLKGSNGPEGYRVSLKVPLKFPELRKKQSRPQARG